MLWYKNESWMGGLERGGPGRADLGVVSQAAEKCGVCCI